MYYLPQNLFGKLTIDSVYHHYDVPRAFLASSRRNKFLVFWTDESEINDTWYYVCVNEREISLYENGKIQLRDVFLYKTLFEVVTPFDTDIESTYRELAAVDVDEEALPPRGFSVCLAEDGTFDVEQRDVDSFDIQNNIHELRLYRERSKKAIGWSAVNEIFGAWQNVYESVVEALKLKDPFLAPQVATPGSYKMQFCANHNAELMEAFTHMGYLLSNKETDISTLERAGIDLDTLEGLISALQEHDLRLDLCSSSGGLLTTIDSRKFKESTESINDFNQRKISSELVPQANDLDRVIVFIIKLANGEVFNSESEDITPRQIMYYKTAARLLGLVKSNHTILTPIGYKVALANSEIEQYKIIASRFETSDCGWAWLKYCEVDSVYDLEPDSAASFLVTMSSGLSENTARRRATTLKQWVETFKIYNQ